jgi:lactoylglutathione lyase
MTQYLHTMIRVTDPVATLAFFALFGVEEVRRFDSEQGRFTLIFLAAPGQAGIAEVELTYNWPTDEDSSTEGAGGAGEAYSQGRNFGHLAYRVEDIYATCQRLMDAGVVINRPPRDGHMAFIRSPDGISIELLQNGNLPRCEPWASMPNVGEW